MGTSSDVRYFDNPYYNYEDSVASLTTSDHVDRNSLKEHLMQTARLVFRKAQHGYGGLYTGAAGITYVYLHILPVLSDDETTALLPLARQLYDEHAKHYEQLIKRKDLRDKDLVGLLSGKAGVDAVGAVLGKVCGDEKLQKSCIAQFASIAKVAKQLDFHPRGSDELFVGRAGYLLAVLWLQKKFGFHYEPLAKEDVRDVWDACIAKGRQNAAEKKSPAPLLYSYHDKNYLGAAHGMSAILQVLLSFPEFCKDDPQALFDIRRTIDLYMELQDSNGNFPSSLGKDGPNHLVHWCHGASGAVYMFAKAYLTFNDPRYLKACIDCAEVVWERGLLKKGPGICHGVAGSGYVFLLLYRLLKKKNSLESSRYLFRATKFAEFINSDEFRKYARVPDRPYSLYEGLGGTLCYYADLLQPENAEFPFFDVWQNYHAA